jgi:hypothetical protein
MAKLFECHQRELPAKRISDDLASLSFGATAKLVEHPIKVLVKSYRDCISHVTQCITNPLHAQEQLI